MTALVAESRLSVSWKWGSIGHDSIKRRTYKVNPVVYKNRNNNKHGPKVSKRVNISKIYAD